LRTFSTRDFSDSSFMKIGSLELDLKGIHQPARYGGEEATSLLQFAGSFRWNDFLS
jgi:hypothetical protein